LTNFLPTAVCEITINVMAGLVPAIPIPDTLTMKPGYVYILATRPGGAIYVGVTGNLAKRGAEHKSGLVAGHTNAIASTNWFISRRSTIFATHFSERRMSSIGRALTRPG
jgi:putative endonuclease